ncbi:MAG: TetR/AcrR family transcriptional regulator [Streptosporangiaceae bacterium]
MAEAGRQDPPAGAAPEPGPAQPRRERRMRADAVRNREAVLTAAREAFAEDGLEAPLEQIARRAGVGIGTLYRRFPAREQLIAAALMDKISQYAEIAEQAVHEPDPWTGFAGFVERICAMQADDRGLADLLLITLAPCEQIEAIRARANRSVIALMERAKAAGQLRSQLAGEDLLMLFLATSAIAAATRRDAPGALPRFVALMLDAFRPQPAGDLPGAPTKAQMTRVMRRLADAHGCGEPQA